MPKSKLSALRKSDFWKEFHLKFWEKTPVVLNDTSGLGTVTISSEQLFEVVLRFTESLRAGEDKGHYLRVIVDGVEKEPDKGALPYLPSRKDGSFENYNERLLSGDKNLRYAIIIHGLETYDSHFFESICRQIQPLVSEIGFPMKWHLIMFLGNYDASPFGVHIDHGGVFQFPVVGTKKIRTWTGDYSDKHPDLKFATRYQRHLKESVLLEANPGGMIYWPSNRWHVGEAKGGAFSVAVSLPHYTYYDFSSRFIEDELLKQLRFPDERVSLKSTALRVKSTHFEQTAREYAKVEERNFLKFREKVFSPEVRQTFREKFLRQISAYGFQEIPQAHHQNKLSPEHWIRVDSIFPILSLPHVFLPNAFVVACKGQSLVIRNAPFLTLLLRQLNAGEAVSVSTLLAIFTSKKIKASHIMKILQTIHKVGSFELIESGTQTVSKNAA